jgi:hypothetical protein
LFLKKSKPVQTDRFQFGLVQFLWKKTGSNQLGSVFLWFGSVFFSLGSVRFFQFQAYKTGTKPVGFLKILIGFF